MVTYNLMPGALTIDLVDGSVHGDLDHCPKEDLLESARALLSLLPQVRHKGLWGLGKDYDASCYLHSAGKRYTVPDGLSLPVLGLHPSRKFSLISTHSESRGEYWERNTYGKLIGSIRDDQVSEDITGVSSHYDTEKWERPRSDPRAQLTSRVAKAAPGRGGSKVVREETHEMRPRMF